MRPVLSRDELRKGLLGHTQGMQGMMLSSAVDGRTPNYTPGDFAPTSQSNPFDIGIIGKVEPGMVGTVMPTLDGEQLDTTAHVIDLTLYSGNFVVWFTCTWATTYLNNYLSSATQTAVTVEYGTSVPSDSDTSAVATKHLQFNTVTNGQPSTSFFSTSIPVQLKDNGANASIMTYT